MTPVAASGPLGTFGDLAGPVCGPGEGAESTEKGVTADEIKVGVVGDANNVILPGLNKEMFDASRAFVTWCNKAGGINGRKIDLTVRDAGLVKAPEVMTQACAEDFAVVGGGLALDFQAVKVRTACGLTEFPGFSNSSEAREADHQVQASPQYRDRMTIGLYAGIANAFPDAIGHFGLITSSAQLGSGRPFDVRLMDAIGPLGYRYAYKAQLPPPPTPIDNWRPYVEEMKGKGVRVLDFEVTLEYLVPLMRAMRDVGWFPDAIVLQMNFYNSAFIEGNDALKNTWIASNIYPLENAESNPPTQQFLDIMNANAPGWKRGGLAVNSFSAWLLFAQAAKACGAELTRACVEEKGLATGTWTGGGLHAPVEVDTKANPEPEVCGYLLAATAEGFKIDEKLTRPNKGIYHCSKKHSVKVAP